MNRSENINELAIALATAQGNLENATKGTENKFFKSSYADLAECLNTIRPVFSAAGLSFVQLPSTEGNLVSVETMLIHKSGQFISNILTAPVKTLDAQNIGSVVTYLRRYSISAFAGISQQDDDGNQASGKIETQVQQKAQIQPYSAADFSKNFGVWQSAIASGKKTADEIISAITSKYSLTAEQIQQIKGVTV